MASKQNNQSAKGSNSSILVGGILAIVVFALVFIFLTSIQRKESIMVAAKDVAPYSNVTTANFKKINVPKDSVTPNDITPDDFNKLTKEGALTINSIRTDQRLDVRDVTTSPYGSLNVVGPDERLIAVTTTQPGAVGNGLTPGVVADYYTGGSGSSDGAASGPTVSDAKVIGIGANSGAVASGNSDNANGKSDSSKNQQNQGLIVLIAVPQDSAAAAGGQGSFAINTHKCFNASGSIETLKNGVCPQAKGDNNPSDNPAVDTTDPNLVTGETGATSEGATSVTPDTGE